MNGIIHDRNGSYTEESQEGCALNLLQTDQQNIPKLQATEVQWQDYDWILVLFLLHFCEASVIGHCSVEMLGQLSL